MIPVIPQELWRLPAASRLFRADPDPRALRRFQSQRLRSLVRHAAATVPFYRELYARHGFDADSVAGIEDLSRIPTCGKDDLSGLPPAAVTSTSFRGAWVKTRHTSGSTGRPARIRTSWLEDRLLSLLHHWAGFRAGVRRGDRVARVRNLLPHAVLPPEARFLRWAGLYRAEVIDAFLSPDEIGRRLAEYSPDVIRGYPGTLALAAPYFAAHPQAKPPRLVLVGGENVTDLAVEQISGGFQAPVRTAYGSHEFSLMAWECTLGGGLHVFEQGVLLEVLRDGKPVAEGEEGEVVATALHSFLQPFIRYRIDDLAVRGATPCSCGAPYSTLKEVKGRTCDVLVLPDGTLLSPFRIFRAINRTIRWIRQYQLEQKGPHEILLRLVPASDPGAGDLRSVERILRELLGEGVSTRIELVSRIDREPSGKFRLCRSFLNRETTPADLPGGSGPTPAR